MLSPSCGALAAPASPTGAPGSLPHPSIGRGPHRLPGAFRRRAHRHLLVAKRPRGPAPALTRLPQVSRRTIASSSAATTESIAGQPQPLVAARPILRCMPLRVVGMPVARAKRYRARDTPRARFHEKERPGIPVLVRRLRLAIMSTSVPRQRPHTLLRLGGALTASPGARAAYGGRPSLARSARRRPGRAGAGALCVVCPARVRACARTHRSRGACPLAATTSASRVRQCPA